MQNIDQIIYDKIFHILHNLGIPSHLDGYKYLKYLLYETIALNSLDNDYYSFLETKLNIDRKIIEKSIRYAIDIGWSRGNNCYAEKVFGYSINLNKNKPTNYEFIFTILEVLKNQ